MDWNDPEAVNALAAEMDTEDAARTARLKRPEALAEGALWYAEQGLLVFPLHEPTGPANDEGARACSCGDPRCPSPAKHPRTGHGLHDATGDVDTVKAWWRRWPQANIGLRTGITFDVIDVDVEHHADPPKPNGYLALADLRERGALPEVLGRVFTSRGGAHLYVPVTGRGNKAGLYPGIDYRGAGGYVVAPPSRSPVAGRMWMWTDPVDFAALAPIDGTAT